VPLRGKLPLQKLHLLKKKQRTIALQMWSEDNGCYQVSYGSGKRSKAYILGYGNRTNPTLETEECEEIPENWLSGNPGISQLILGKSNGGSFVTARGFAHGDYLILGCQSFWTNCGLRTCYETVTKLADAETDKTEIAQELPKAASRYWQSLTNKFLGTTEALQTNTQEAVVVLEL
jgi:hypothetical protein